MNERCLVLGGSGALGRVVVETLVKGGARVAFTYHRNEAVVRQLVVAHPGSAAFQMDLANVASVESAVDAAAGALSGLDALVQCAGVAITVASDDPRAHHDIPDVDERAFDAMLDVNVKGTFFAVRRALSFLRASGGGNIVFVGSIDGVKPAPSPVHYAASKGALRGMAQAMAKELGPAGIKVNMVAPGVMEGGVSRAIPLTILEEYVKHCGLKRVGRFAEIAAPIAWLATRNTYVTGQTIVVDGAL